MLKNSFIKIDITLSKEETRNMLHTKEEKYAHIYANNKDIQLLKDKLDLTII